MAFDWKAFGASFLGEVTEGIEERGTEAKAYKEKQEAAAERNKSLITQRNSRARQAAQYGRQAETLMGAYPQGKALVRQAMASGMGTVQELYEKLDKAANAPGQNGRLGVDDIEAIINMPSIPAVDQSLMDMSIEDYAKKTYGASTSTQVAAPEDDTSAVGKLFGFGSKDRVKRELAEQDFGGGMTVAEINQLARQEEYTSLIPGATMVFTERNMFDTEKAFDFSKKITDVITDAIETDQAESYIKSARLASNQPGMTVTEQIAAANKAETQAIKDLQMVAAKPLIDYYADVYNTGKFFDNRLAVQTIAGVMGEEYVTTLREQYSIEAPDSVGNGTEPESIEPETVVPETVVPEAVVPEAEVTTEKYPTAEPYDETSTKLVEQAMEGTFYDGNYSDKYTRDQWDEMSRSERRERGLPESPAGGSLNFYFRDELDELIGSSVKTLDIIRSASKPNYKVKISGKIGTFNITAEQLKTLNESYFITDNPKISIEEYDEGEERVRKNMSSRDLAAFGAGS
tara:strand:+ start:3499 stop:5046 length:1548 start_codon:yes stop_codon:yes gene_type:complete